MTGRGFARRACTGTSSDLERNYPGTSRPGKISVPENYPGNASLIVHAAQRIHVGKFLEINRGDLDRDVIGWLLDIRLDMLVRSEKIDINITKTILAQDRVFIAFRRFCFARAFDAVDVNILPDFFVDIFAFG